MKRWIVLVLVMVMVFSVVGCSGSGEPSKPQQIDDGGNNDKEKNDMPVESSSDSSGDFFQLQNAFDVASNFRELEYTYSVTEANGQKGVARYAFSVLDEKTIDGMKAYQILFERSGDGVQSTAECWINEKQVLEGSKDGKELKEEYELLLVNTTLNSMLMPFVFTIMYEQVITKPVMRQVLGWDITEEGSKSISLDGTNVTVQYYEMTSKSDEKAYFEVASLEGKNLFLNYETNKDGKHYEFNTIRLVTH